MTAWVAPRHAGLTRRDTTIAVAVLALAVGLWALRWRGVDYPAHIYRVDLVRRHGLALWNANWYGGHHTPGYGLVFPWIASITGLAVPAIASTVGSVLLFSRLMRRAAMPHVATGTCAFAFLMLVNLYEGRLPFALGVLFGLLAVTFASSRRWALAVIATLIATLSSPLAGAFAALAFATWALVQPRTRLRDVLRKPGTFLAAVAITPIVVFAEWFPQGGWFPYRGGELLLALAAGALVWWLLPPPLAAVRWGFTLAAVVAVPLYFVPNPMGGNLSRLAVIGAPILFCAPRTRPLLHVAVGLTLVFWQAKPLMYLPERVEDPSSKAEYHQPLIDAVESLADGPVRIEIPFTDAHWEAAYVAAELPLARGWERQLDHRYNQVLYDVDLDHTAYREWLVDNGVSYVAVPDVELERSAEREAALAADAPYLRLVWQNANWKLYEVLGSPGLLTGPGTLLELNGDIVRVSVEKPGLFTLRVRYSSHLTVLDERGCVAETAAGWTIVRAYQPGLLELTTSLDGAGDATCK
ncbi:MAG TPA: hypothetical protein VF183_01735 [Acidimicrobiales bacterium]